MISAWAKRSLRCAFLLPLCRCSPPASPTSPLCPPSWPGSPSPRRRTPSLPIYPTHGVIWYFSSLSLYGPMGISFALINLLCLLQDFFRALDAKTNLAKMRVKNGSGQGSSGTQWTWNLCHVPTFHPSLQFNARTVNIQCDTHVFDTIKSSFQRLCAYKVKMSVQLRVKL